MVRVTIGYVVVAVAILQTADVVLPALSLPEVSMTVITITAIVGLPVTIALAWAYDITPFGVQKTAPLAVPDAVELGVAAPFAAPNPDDDRQSIAVLPFVDMSPEGDQEYFGDGIAEELINRLVRLQTLRVVARTSSFSFKGDNRDMREIGRRLGVETLLEGSVRKAGDQLRVTAQLISVTDGSHLWSETYDRATGDIFKVQDDISASVIEAMLGVLLTDPSHGDSELGTANPEAYDLYLKGRHFWRRRYKVGLQHAIQYFERAVEVDPGYALPYAALSEVVTVGGIYSFMPESDAEARSTQLATRALQLDPKLPEAHMAMALVQSYFRWEWEAAEEHFQQALAAAVDEGEMLARAAQLSAFRGRFEEAIERAEQARFLHPDSSYVRWLLGAVYMYTGHNTEAITELEDLLAEDPEATAPMFVIGEALSHVGRHDEAVEILEKAAGLTHRASVFLGVLGGVYGLAGREEEARAVLAELNGRREKEFVSPVPVARVYGSVGEIDTAFTCLDEAARISRATLTQSIRNPGWSPLWSDDRWDGLLTTMGLGPIA